MSEQRERARADAAAKKSGHTDTAVYNQVLASSAQPTRFLGYDESTVGTTIGSVLVNGQLVNSVDAPAEVEIVLAATPFGQLAGQGTVTAAGGATVRGADGQAPVTGGTGERRAGAAGRRQETP